MPLKPAVKKIFISISGTHCASCVSAIENALGSFKGVKSASVNFASEKAKIEYDPALVVEQYEKKYHQIIKKGLCYHKSLDPLKKRARGRRKQRPGKNLLDRLICHHQLKTIPKPTTCDFRTIKLSGTN